VRSRRRFLSTLAAAGAASWNLDRLLHGLDADLIGRADAAAADLLPIPGGHFVRTVPLGRFDDRPRPPLDTRLGAGLDARQFTDIATLTPDTLIIPTARFFIRTAASPANVQPGPWTVTLGGRVRQPIDLTIDALAAQAVPMGTHLMECSGNADPANFGLISTARWTGVPMAAVLDRVQPLTGPWRVRVTGLDDEVTPSRSSVPGASWIFSGNDLHQAGAFLATGMNGGPLPPDHGFPVRLVMPNWYGCTCIKWVSRIDLVPDDEPATPHMQEFAARTHQDGVPRLAREFEPPIIDLAAMPVRVEQWHAAGRLLYRIVGVRWGGSTPSCALTIRFKVNEPFVPVDHCDGASTSASGAKSPRSTSWSLWSHVWRPHAPGRYQIVLATSDPTIRTRRLDLRYYTRDVQIDEA
jgi:DMSO/TMAO reductase YedYZ molybdopterin-dependent catalytic subunit